jgi:para-aminobenzoate synthetase component 1
LKNNLANRLRIKVKILKDFVLKLQKFAAGHEHYCCLDSNSQASYTYPDETRFDHIIAFESIDFIQPKSDAFAALKEYRNKHSDWLFGHFSYDLKNEVEKLSSDNPPSSGFPELFFFRPKWLFICEEGHWRAEVFEEHLPELDQLLRDIESVDVAPKNFPDVDFEPQITHAQYIKRVMSLKHHIQIGDIYEANFCQNFVSPNSEIEPSSTFQRLQKISPTPFAAVYGVSGQHLICASPERFIAKQKSTLISQPIKGTAKRGSDREEDEKIKEVLRSDPKEQSENVMIVDLVRNDLSRTAEKGSVRVDELFGVYSFETVHQLISTVKSELRDNVDFVDALKLAFPMGSMTGAPKVKAMQLIEEHESFKRGLYSGSVGYFDPSGNADFNVVIRSILYNAPEKTVSFAVGGAITSLCDPEKEYEESLLKAQGMIKALKNG